MEELIELLEEIQPDADFENCDTLIDDGILDSFAIVNRKMPPYIYFHFFHYIEIYTFCQSL